MNKDNIKISAYCTSRCANEMEYPFTEAIRSVAAFADEVIVLDTSDKDDGTRDVLNNLSKELDGKLKVHFETVAWESVNHGILDGQTKAMARQKCTGDFLYQLDLDECVHEDDTRGKIIDVLERAKFLTEIPLMALPVAEFWGSAGKVRMDINPWKWRLSRNHPDITHGIPAQLRKYVDGKLYSHHGSDGCDYISKSTGQVIPCMSFMPQEVEQLRQTALWNEKLVPKYEAWFNKVLTELPGGVFHYSWYSIADKIKRYKFFWNDSWKSLYGEQEDRTWNPFFDKPLDTITEKEILDKAAELEESTGGHIFHQSWQGSCTPHIQITNKNPPLIMKEWTEKHKRK